MPSAGWYQDPEGNGWRWWDGAAWGERLDAHAPAGSGAERQHGRRGLGWGRIDLGLDLGSAWAVRLSTIVAIVAGCAATVALAVLVHAAFGGHLGVAPLLLVVGVPILVMGQLWCIAIILARLEDRRREDPVTTSSTRLRTGANWLRDLRGGLPVPVAVAGLLLFYGATLAGPGAALFGPAGSHVGVPTDDPSACAHVIDEHGSSMCLTEAEYEERQAATQRYVAGVFLAFFIAHAVVASGEVLRQRRPGAPPVHSSR